MNHKKSLFQVIFPTTLLLLSLTSTIPAGYMSTKTRVVYSLPRYGGITINVSAPCKVDPGENINLTILAEAAEDVDVEYKCLNIYGFENETDEILLKSINFSLQAPPANQVNYEITIPDDIFPSLIYGKIEIKWTYGGLLGEKTEWFVVSYVENEEFIQLQEEYEQLSENYSILMSNYTSLNVTFNELESKYEGSAGEIAGVRNLMYVFVVTTIIAAVSAVLIALRSRKIGTYF